MEKKQSKGGMDSRGTMMSTLCVVVVEDRKHIKNQKEKSN